MPNLVQSSGNGNAVGAYTGGANPWADAARDVETGTYLKFNGNDGIYSFGQDDEELPRGSRVVGDMESMALGWTCWVDGTVEEEVFVAVIDGRPPAEHTLTDYGPYNEDDGWRESSKISLILESFGEDDQDDAVGTPLLWKTSTGGQVRQIKKLSGAYGRLFAQHPGEFPIIELDAESYAPRNKKHGKIKWSPKLKIVGWMTAAELEGLTGVPGEDDEDEHDEPAPRGRRAAPGKEDTADEPAPRRGRRQADDDDGGDDEAPAPRRGRRQAAEDEGDEAPAPAPRGRRRPSKDEPTEDDDDEAPAPASRGRRRSTQNDEDAGDDEAPAPRRGRRQAAAEDDGADEGDEDVAPRRGRGAPPRNARLRKFD